MSKKPKFTAIGIVAVLVALAADALSNYNKEKTMKAEIKEAVDKAVAEKLSKREEA